MTFYATWIKEIVEIPIFKSAELSDVEMKCLTYVSKSKTIMVNDLGKNLKVSTTHAYRILGKLENENYISKVEGRWTCLLKGKIVLSVS